jgi:hypothetical protein
VNVIVESNVSEVIEQLKSFAESLKKIGEETMFNAATEVQDRMKEEGDPVPSFEDKKPYINWDSDKQRKAFFATNGFGAGIPYKRTGAYEQGWKVDRTDGGAELSNSHPAGAVGGWVSPTSVQIGWQSNIHTGRWNNIFDVIDTLDITRLFAAEWEKRNG